MSSEIQKLRKEIKRLQKLAHHDELTGLLNRHGFRESAEKFLGVLSQDQKRRKSLILQNFGLVLFDIDYFKRINDAYGHAAGDETLRLFAKIVKERIRDIDIVGRWGGEEIVLGLVGASARDAFNVAEDIRKNLLDHSFNYKRKRISFTVSAGIVDVKKSKNLNTLLDLADKALYKAKKLGRNISVAVK